MKTFCFLLFAFIGASASEQCHLSLMDTESGTAIPDDCQRISIQINNSTKLVLPIDINKAMSAGVDKAIGINDSRMLKRKKSTFISGESTDGSFNLYQAPSGAMAGSIIDLRENTISQVKMSSRGKRYAKTRKMSSFPDERDSFELPTEISDANVSGDTSTIMRNGSGDEGDILDIMVPWTKQAECWNAGYEDGICDVDEDTEEMMEALIELAVEETNLAFTKSAINTQLNLVHMYRTNYVEKNRAENSLHDLRNGEKEGLENIHELREEKGADLVQMIVGTPQWCGWAYLGPSKEKMFSVTRDDCATGYFTFGHEIGHNLGLYHDRGTANACKSKSANYGYREKNGLFRTIMSYNCRSKKQCDKMKTDKGCPRIQRFSNPDILFNGKPVGIKDKADGARSINNVLSEVAKYFVHVDPNTDSPSIKPSNEPSSLPSNIPSDTFNPTMVPSQAPSISVSPSDSNRPSNSSSPSKTESDSPSMSPSILSSQPSMYPSIDPTKLPSQLPSNAPSYIPSSVHSSTPTTSICENNDDFEFWKDPKKQKKRISCSKIKKDKDIEKYCIGREEVRENCRLACRLCEANEETDQCANDRNYTFTIKSGEVKSCDWISKSGKEWRLRDYCSEVKNGFRIGEMCKQACNEC